MKSMISLIINREYMTRIRKKSFIVMSILGPFIFAAYVLLPIYFATMEDKDEKKVVVLDDSKLFTEYGPNGASCVIPDREFPCRPSRRASINRVTKPSSSFPKTSCRPYRH